MTLKPDLEEEEAPHEYVSVPPIWQAVLAGVLLVLICKLVEWLGWMG